MKKKRILFCVAAMMLAAMAAGCGKTDTDDAAHVISYQRRFDNSESSTGIDGPCTYMNVYKIEGEDDWIYNETCLIFGDEESVDEYWRGRTVSFAWESIPEMGNFIYLYTHGNSMDYYDVSFLAATNYWLQAWYGGDISNDADRMVNADRAAIFSMVGSATPDEDSFVSEEDEKGCRVIFKFYDEEIQYTGYACFIDDYTRNECFQFTYRESNDVYDEERVLRTINSITIIDKPETDVHNIK